MVERGNKDEGVAPDLWKMAEETVSSTPEIHNLNNADFDKTVLFLGEKQSGKTSLIQSFLGQLREEREPKPTTALDYRYVKRNNTQKREIAHIYELGGGRLLSDLISVPVNLETLHNSIAIIAVDLSKPGSAISSLRYWLGCLRKKVMQTFSTLAKQKPTIHQSLKDQIVTKWRDHEDREMISPQLTPIKIIIVATKYDIYFNNQESEKQKWMSRTLRFLAHTHGASLLSFSTKEQKLQTYFKAMMNHYTFGSSFGSHNNTDHGKPLLITAGHDRLSSIGMPKDTGRGASIDDLTQSWERTFYSVFDQEDAETNNKHREFDPNLYTEERVDSMRREKDKELERYSKENERKSKFDKDSSPDKAENRRKMKKNLN
mmetsp:Transcript_60726/g.69384  ORF Transcript_60726/g.69384 Transcript_60726/m.69384 type:complete len:374 (+) Transcript_60726:59-1180(+)|eukprot:CAMPEP_0114987308 /NCGR_PEP_ID=MMETSP0216-20121206/8932_1 /TAXON_ID=223996 /ORGANISM="Protocruzia adherens, Strain Boccale" /LENGTH=373 /DNA_ID=CAMNT_0002349885 /DNA_START=43 /DNA_END=1164 /DNA_ORIENTATION=-